MGVIMIHPSSIAFDIDGVFADILSLFIKIANSEFNISGLKYDDITSYDLRDCLEIDPLIIDEIIGLILSGNYCSSLKPVEGAQDVLTRLGNYNGRILFVTAREKEYPIYDWILNMLPLESTARVSAVLCQVNFVNPTGGCLSSTDPSSAASETSGRVRDRDRETPPRGGPAAHPGAHPLRQATAWRRSGN